MPVVVPSEAFAFATLDDLAILLGKTTAAELTAQQTAMGEMLLPLATGLILNEVGKAEAWAQALDAIPAILRAVCLAMVKRVMDNPSSVRAQSETLGQYQHSVSFTDGAHGLLLADAEAALCRRATWGRLSATTHPATTLDQVIELCETGDIA